MTKKRRTKRALLNSIVSMILGFSMLLGTTFAWFTDTETSGINQIVAGNLDVELYTDEGPIEESTKLFYGVDGNAMKWEPGAVAYENLTIANEGNLALKYELKLNIAGENATEEGNYKLSDVLQFAVVDAIPEGTSRKEVLEMATTKEKSSGSLTSLSVEGKLEPGTKTDEIGLVIFWEPNNDEVDNLYNLKNERNTGTSENTGWPTTDGKMLHINLGINLYATQLEHEYDSFGNDYDGDASYIEAWDGVTVTTPTADANGIYHITNGAELAGIRNIISETAGERSIHVVLDADINLGNEEWTPLGTGDNFGEAFAGTFDGQGYTIYNLSVTGTSDDAGLFRTVRNGEIKNLVLKNVSVSGDERVGAIAGKSLCADIVNCDVIDGIISGQSKVGGLVGDLVSAEVTNCSVSGLTVVAEERTAALIGRARKDGSDSVVENNIAEDSIVIATKADSAEYFVGENTNEIDLSSNTQNNVELKKQQTMIYVSTAEDLIALGGKSLEGYIMLTDDIDLEGQAMATIGAAYGKSLTVIGNGHTISNAELAHTNHNGMKHHSLFYAYTNSVLNISDLVIENVNIDTAGDTERNYGVAVVVSYADGGSEVILDNVDVKNCSVLNDNDEAAVYVGYHTGTVTMVDCDSTGCSVEGETTVKTGAFIGHVDGKATLTNCTTDLTIGASNRITGTLIIDGAEAVASDDSLKTALMANEETVNVTLVSDVNLNVSDAYIKLGGEDTQTVTINGNGKTLTLDTTYWSRLNLANPDATLVLNDVTVTSSQASGTWNSYDVTFNCNVELNNVKFEKAVALDNPGKTSILNNVTINEKNGDYYALWIVAGGDVTAKGLNITSVGRGIKIDEQYVDAPALTKLNISDATFETVKKAAIMVKSSAGAEITLSDIDISKVAADTTNAVWVDEDSKDYNDLVTVVGGTKKVEGQ